MPRRAITDWMPLPSVATAVYQGNVTVPDGVPADAATSAGDGITGAVAVAGTLPEAWDGAAPA